VVKLIGPALHKGRLRRFTDKMVLLQQGEAGDSLFIVVAGDVRLFARKDRDSAEVGHAHKTEVLGEGEVVDGRGLRHHSAVAVGQVDVLEVPRELLLANGQLPPALATLLRDVHQRRKRSLDEMSDFLNRW
jgi:CRP-like cAMP-binding protein